MDRYVCSYGKKKQKKGAEALQKFELSLAKVEAAMRRDNPQLLEHFENDTFRECSSWLEVP